MALYLGDVVGSFKEKFEKELEIKIVNYRNVEVAMKFGAWRGFHCLEIVDEKPDSAFDGGIFFIYEFPSQCSWIVVGRLSSGEGNNRIFEISKKIAKELAYSAIVVSDNISKANEWIERGFESIFSNYNYHSGNRNTMLIYDLTKEK